MLLTLTDWLIPICIYLCGYDVCSRTVLLITSRAVTETEPDVYEKPETPITEVYQRRFTSAVRASLGEGNPGTLPSAEKK